MQGNPYGERQEVDHTSLRSASDDIHRVAGHLDDLAKQTFMSAGRHPLCNAGEPGAEFDAEYADLMRVMPQAYASRIEQLYRVANGVIEHSGNHQHAEQANETVVNPTGS